MNIPGMILFGNCCSAQDVDVDDVWEESAGGKEDPYTDEEYEEDQLDTASVEGTSGA